MESAVALGVMRMTPSSLARPVMALVQPEVAAPTIILMPWDTRLLKALTHSVSVP